MQIVVGFDADVLLNVEDKGELRYVVETICIGFRNVNCRE